MRRNTFDQFVLDVAFYLFPAVICAYVVFAFTGTAGCSSGTIEPEVVDHGEKESPAPPMKFDDITAESPKDICPKCPTCPKCPALTKGETSAKTKTGPANPTPNNTRVVIVLVDGFHPGLVEDMPRFRKLMKHGSWTLKARTTDPSITTVAHAAMFTGAPPERNGVTRGAPRNTRKLELWRPLKLKTIFDVADRKGIGTMAWVQKPKLAGLIPLESLDEFGDVRSNAQLVDRACMEFKYVHGSRLIFIHLKKLDAVGHHLGWLSRQQRKAAGVIDIVLAQLSSCIAEAQEEHGDPFALIITSDHGGHSRTHGSRKDSDTLIPWLIIAPGVKVGHEIGCQVHLRHTAGTALKQLGLDSVKVLPTADKVTCEDFYKQK